MQHVDNLEGKVGSSSGSNDGLRSTTTRKRDVPAGVKVSRMLGFCLATLCILLCINSCMSVSIERNKKSGWTA